MELEDLEEGEKILYNDKKTPLTVKEKTDNGIWVQGPNGGQYLLYEQDDVVLTSKNERKQYSSLVENLRKVGEWIRDGDRWHHSKTDAVIHITEAETGNYKVLGDNIALTIDQPGYGYLKKEPAVEDIEKFIGKHPEGTDSS
ncbi:hypothetical protein [Candidatus Nanohalococcus occultus]|uniref:hypothetical protein n=1 Tax=Candidatus Nanohalococcus occultus TaxID=2978047 RepID=UPI0039DF69AE